MRIVITGAVDLALRYGIAAPQVADILQEFGLHVPTQRGEGETPSRVHGTREIAFPPFPFVGIYDVRDEQIIVL